jgi:hypothetical protein
MIAGALLMTAVLWEPYLEEVPALNDMQIAQYESEIGKKLPDDYKNALLQNQGKSTGKAIKIGSKSKTNLGPLLFIGTSTNSDSNLYSVSRARKNIMEWSGETGLVPITSNTSTGYFCFDYRDTDSDPKIVFVDMSYDLEELDGGIAVADNFTELLQKLED